MSIFLVQMHFYADEFYGKHSYKMAPLISAPSPHVTHVIMSHYMGKGIL